MWQQYAEGLLPSNCNESTFVSNIVGSGISSILGGVFLESLSDSQRSMSSNPERELSFSSSVAIASSMIYDVKLIVLYVKKLIKWNIFYD